MMARKLSAALALMLPLMALAQATPPAQPETAPSPPAAPPAATPPPAAPPAAAAPAAPTPPLAQIYGTLNVNLQYIEAKGATAANVDVAPRFAISTDSTNIGIRGTLKLQDWASAVYQCETSANLDGEGAAVLFCNRNSRVGLSSPYGTIAYGNWDTPFKAMHYGTKADDPFGNTDVFDYAGLLGSPGYGSRTSAFNAATTNFPSASFDQRGANSLLYWSPKLANMVTVRLQWSVDDLKTAEGQVNPNLLGGGVAFEMGPLAVVGSVEYHEDAYGIRVTSGANATNIAAKDFAWRLAAGYDIPLAGVGTLNVMAMVDQLQYKQDDATTGFTKYSRFAWMGGLKFRTGDHELRFRYSQALKPDITSATATAANEDDLGAQSWAIGYAYYLAKSTQLYAFYTEIKNEDRARYTFAVGGSAAVVGANTPAGSDPRAFGLGIRYAF